MCVKLQALTTTALTSSLIDETTIVIVVEDIVLAELSVGRVCLKQGKGIDKVVCRLSVAEFLACLLC